MLHAVFSHANSSSRLCRIKAPHAGANARLQVLLENSKSKKGHYLVQKMRITPLTGMDCPFDGKQLI